MYNMEEIKCTEKKKPFIWNQIGHVMKADPIP